MLKYICTHCDNLACETSVCPVCHERTELISSDIFYCHHCNAPSFSETCEVCGKPCTRVSSDLRPVFADERLLIEVLTDKPFAYVGKSVWCCGGSNYLIDGEKLKLNFVKLRNKDPEEIIRKLNYHLPKNIKYINEDFSNEHIKKFLECNKIRLNTITDEALEYIRGISKGFDSSSMFVSFSGGKDSTVTSHLAMRALSNEQIIHIYGDTTLEYPESSKYIAEFRSKYPNTPVLVAKNKDQDFQDLCDVVGPPSRVMRWCCTIFKTGAIAKKIEQVFKNKPRLLSFQGIRRAESISRSKYERDTDSPKISKQVVSSPIIDWTDFDVWLYILSNDIPFNGAYRQGFSRVGCWCCPNNSDWSSFLASIYMNEEHTKFKELLYEFAKKVGKIDWKDYVDTGKWKARQGGNGLEYSKNTIVTFRPCVFDETSLNFTLSRNIDDDLYTLFKPFGILNFNIGNKRLGEVYVLSRRTQEPILKLTGLVGQKELKITALKAVKPFNSIKELLDLSKNQLTKFQTCIGCTYCQSVCKFGALKVSNKEKGFLSNRAIYYNIDEEKCVGCLECVKHFSGGCYMKKVLRIKNEADTNER